MMLCIDQKQLDDLNAMARARLFPEGRARLLNKHTELFLNEETDRLDKVLLPFVDAGFDTVPLLFEAIDLFFQVGQRTDSDAAEARAFVASVLFSNDHSPGSRLEFLRAQQLAH